MGIPVCRSFPTRHGAAAAVLLIVIISGMAILAPNATNPGPATILHVGADDHFANRALPLENLVAIHDLFGMD
jgi:hypothetical protein